MKRRIREAAEAEERDFYQRRAPDEWLAALAPLGTDAGLATLTHTPSPMAFLNELLGRPRHEVPYLLLVVGHPAHGCRVPAIERKALSDVATFF